MQKLTMLSLPLLALLAGCTAYVSNDPANVYSMPQPGSTVQLNQTLEVPGGYTRVFLQRGKVVAKQAFDRYVPNCNFEIRTIAETPRSIQPEAFIVTRVRRETAEVVRLDTETDLVMSGDYDGPPMIVHGVHMWLGSSEQPDVMRLTCRGAFDDMPEAFPPSIEEMKASLGEIAELKLI